MRIGIPKEIKDQEYRIGGTPAMVKILKKHNHEVLVEKNAGEAIGITDSHFSAVGATIVDSPKEVYDTDLIIKVKEPQAAEYPLLKKGQILFCYLHLAPDKEQTKALLEKKVIGIAFETVVDVKGALPLLAPMSEVAGRIAIQAGAYCLHMVNKGRGVLLGGVPGVSPGSVVIIGGGVVGTQAAKMAIGLGAEVTILDTNVQRLRELDSLFGNRCKTLYSTPLSLEEKVCSADLVIGAVLIPGHLAPKLVTKSMVERMKKGAVIVDVAIDQGGCIETSHPTTHSNPIFLHENVVHYCVANMPGACAHTATFALANSTLPYVLRIANQGYKEALSHDPLFLSGLNVCLGKVTNENVAHARNYPYCPPMKALSIG